jgi:fructose-1,6-bisphosphatase/inositol monophosphatase family enzyme
MTFLLSNEPTTTTLRHSIIDLEFGYGLSNEAICKMVGVVERLLQHGCRATRSLGSGVLNMCYVATGRLDVVYAGVANEGWKPWDYCAASVIQ